jgi:decaprenylphospho-beta-D-erythro-pentofuranosid-2-ulose 2-reductase
MASGGRWKWALVVGASSGIGEELARQLARAGCQVALVARRKDELERIAAEIDQAAGEHRALTYVHDVREYECVPALFQQIAHDLGGLDLIIYAAGVMPRLVDEEYAFDKDLLTLGTNLLGAIAWLNEAAQRFTRARAGTIVGLSSVAGDRGRRGMPAYCTSKAALDTYLEALRNRIARYGVAVVTIKPGPVATPMTEGLDKLPLLISADGEPLPVHRAIRLSGKFALQRHRYLHISGSGFTQPKTRFASGKRTDYCLFQSDYMQT